MAIKYITIKCTSNTAAAQVTELPWKYGKKGFIALEFDDGTNGARKMMDIFKLNTGGKYRSYSYTDGCGNEIFYRTSLAINGNFEKGQPGYDSTYITPAKLLEFIVSGGDLINHTYVHGGDSISKSQNLSRLENSLYRTTGYRFNGIAIPNADKGFATAGAALKYAYADAQNGDTFDGRRAAHKVMPTSYTDMMCIVRDFNDDWTPGGEEIQYTKSQIDMFLTGERNFWIEGSHSGLSTALEVQGYMQMIDYIKDKLGDTVAVGPVREFVEYQQMKNCPMSVRKFGNEIKVAIDTKNLSNRVRWQDVSLKISGATMQSVTVDGFDSYSFNPKTGLLNAFKQQTNWRNKKSAKK